MTNTSGRFTSPPLYLCALRIITLLLLCACTSLPFTSSPLCFLPLYPAPLYFFTLCRRYPLPFYAFTVSLLLRPLFTPISFYFFTPLLLYPLHSLPLYFLPLLLHDPFACVPIYSGAPTCFIPVDIYLFTFCTPICLAT